MENDILDSLEDLGYDGDISNETTLRAAVEGSEGGPKSVSYTKLVAWITSELRVLAKLEEMVNATTSPEEHSSFLMELSAFLKELGCPHTQLTEGPVSQRLTSTETRLLLLDFLLAELMAARMLSSATPEQGMTVEMRESEHARDLKALLIALGFPKPPANITPQQLFMKVEQKVNDVKSKAHPSLIGKPLFNGTLSDKQWALLDEMQKEMQSEYQMRREMLIKRLDVTVQSFQWSNKAKMRENDLVKAFRSRRDQLTEIPSVSVGDMLAAREDLAVLEKTSNASVRKATKTPLNKVLIGKVPDRGGRAHELEPPPPEMPSWSQRQPGGGGQGGSSSSQQGGSGGFGGGQQGGSGGYGGGQQGSQGGYSSGQQGGQGGYGGGGGGQQGGQGGYGGGGQQGFQGGFGGQVYTIIYPAGVQVGYSGAQQGYQGGYGGGQQGGYGGRGGGRGGRGGGGGSGFSSGGDRVQGGWNQGGGYNRGGGGYDNRGGGGGYDNRGGGGGYDNRGGGGGYDNRGGGGGYDNRGSYDNRGGGGYRGGGHGGYDNRGYDNRGRGRGRGGRGGNRY
ncbi:protein FAM98B isoform X14 [Penaeus vannamei]|uniref:protein FAM98B isoform X14 n=1 Tax=Penaeus vannamei TaxID=6689 RepID=UPI00387F943D